MEESLGKAILSFLREQVDDRRIKDVPSALADRSASFKVDPRYLVVKSPSVKNLSSFPRFFPDTPLLILMRDGRDAVESLVRTFGHPYEVAMHQWVEGAEIVRDYQTEELRGAQNHMLVRYEDLLEDPQTALTRVFDFLGLDSSAYDFESARELPIRGSSTFRGNGDEWHWRPVERSDDFRPKDRWHGWNLQRRYRFQALAGPLLEYFSYHIEPIEPSLVTKGASTALDAWWRGRQFLRSIPAIRSMVRTIRRRNTNSRLS